MALCVEVGFDTKAFGFCCVAVGDGAEALGAFQVSVKPTITLPKELTTNLPEGMTASQRIGQYIIHLEFLLRAYNAMAAQGYAPKDFGKKAEEAIRPAIAELCKLLPSASTEEKKAEEVKK